MNPKIFKTILLAVFMPVLGWSQPNGLDWEGRFGGSNQDEVRQIIEASNGYLMAVGETQSGASGKSDGLLLILDYSTGRKLAEKRIGGARADGFSAIVQTYDGYFLLAGYTESAGNGKKDAWLVETDEYGNVIWESTFGGAGDDYFSCLAFLTDGTLAAAGQRDGGSKGDIWLAQIEGRKLIGEHQVGKNKYASLSGMALGADGQLALAGNTGAAAESGKGDAFLLKTDIGGKIAWERTFGDKDWDEATHLIATPDDGFAMAGITRSNSAGGLDMWLVKTNNAGFQQWQGAFGGKDDDFAQTVAALPDGSFLLGGRSKSYHSGARTFKGYVVKVTSGGQRAWEWPYGGQKDDAVQAFAVLHNGAVVAAGNSASDAQGADDAWVFRFSESPSAAGGLLGAKQTGIDHSEAVLRTADGKLRPNERSHLTFTLFNQQQTNIPDLQVSVKQTKGANGVRYWEQNYFGNLSAGTNREIRIPVYGDAAVNTADNEFTVTVRSGNQELASFAAGFSSLQPLQAAVEVDNFTFEDSKTSDDETVQVVLHNPGDFAAKPVTVQFKMPAGIQAVSPREVSIPQILPHASQTVKFVYRRTGTLRSDQLSITCTVDFGDQKIEKKLERGAAMGKEIFMLLTQPDETKSDIRSLISNKDVFDVQLAVGSNAPLQQKSFKVLNNSVVVDGSKMDEVRLSAGDKGKSQFGYVYNNKIHLQPGENRLEIEVETPDGKFRTSTMVVTYQPQQPNLHILAIGPSQRDLNYTSKDAGDFAAAFEGQAGPDKLYGKVFIHKMVLPEDTEADDIREAVADLVFQYENPAAAQRILDQDVLLVFISSHGKNSRDGFKLLPSNYDPRYERIRSIDFQLDIVQELNRIQCKKAVFIDACHSGAADSKEMTDIERADALAKLAALNPGLNTMSSCGASEMSYEDAAWENGAFTEAILEAFGNKEVTGPGGAYHADADNNGIITLAELYNYLRLRVPQMVRQQKPGAPTNQTPFMPGNEMDARQLPIFVVK
ncbi:MAG TPA: caspase family protein [Flavilitoribacter sp.]|nr:caspase family protein [Flavilitoribacter sp.]